jgi:hypothetical protein
MSSSFDLHGNHDVGRLTDFSTSHRPVASSVLTVVDICGVGRRALFVEQLQLPTKYLSEEKSGLGGAGAASIVWANAAPAVMPSASRPSRALSTTPLIGAQRSEHR